MAKETKKKEAEVIEEPTLEVVEIELPKAVVVEEPKVVVTEPLTLSEKLLKFLNGKADFVKINDLLRIELKQTAAMQHVNKALRGELQKLVDDGKLVIKNNTHTLLGKNYYEGGKIETQYKTVVNVPIEAKLA